MPERKKQQTFEEALGEHLPDFGIPLVALPAYLKFVLEKLKLLVGPASASVSGNRDEEVVKAERFLLAEMRKTEIGNGALIKFGSIPTPKIILGEEGQDKVINPIYQLPAENSGLEEKKNVLLEQLEKQMEDERKVVAEGRSFESADRLANILRRRKKPRRSRKPLP
jgi:hypothetical protein